MYAICRRTQNIVASTRTAYTCTHIFRTYTEPRHVRRLQSILENRWWMILASGKDGMLSVFSNDLFISPSRMPYKIYIYQGIRLFADDSIRHLTMIWWMNTCLIQSIYMRPAFSISVNQTNNRLRTIHEYKSFFNVSLIALSLPPSISSKQINTHAHTPTLNNLFIFFFLSSSSIGFSSQFFSSIKKYAPWILIQTVPHSESSPMDNCRYDNAYIPKRVPKI